MKDSLELIETTRQYLNYLENHIINVKKAWELLQEKCGDIEYFEPKTIIHGLIDDQIKAHDYSKLSMCEFTDYRDFYYPCKNTEENVMLDPAWSHHLRKNSHHWQMWTTEDYRDREEMLIVNIIHMICDWVAMGFNDNTKNAKEYYELEREKMDFSNFKWDIDSFICELLNKVYR